MYENSRAGEQTTDANTQTALETNVNDTRNHLDTNSTQTSHHNPAQMMSTEDKTTNRKRKEPTELIRKSKRGLIPRKQWPMDAEKAMSTTTPSSCSSITLALQAHSFIFYEPKSYKEAIQSTEGDLWKIATDDEIKSHHKNNTWTLMPLPPGRNCIPSG